MSKNLLSVSRISNWYSGRNIFITGATGFMGKVLVEKLLRSCPNIGKIYILIRSKRGQTPAERLSSILDVPLFDSVKKENSKFAEKIITITGDITLPDLGISSEDKIELINNISVVFHTAATVRFDEPLKDAVTKNILTVEKMINLCYQMRKLEAFVHVSTAYSNCLHKEIEEKIYPSPVDVEKFIEYIQCLDEDIINEITPLLIHGRPNTYTFTKELAEHLVMKHKGKLPIAIFRPSIVISSNEEPLAGWTDTVNGPSGMFLAGAKGIFRSMIGKENCIADVVPVDLAINCMICIASDLTNFKLDKIPIYNYTSGILNPITWGEFYAHGVTYGLKYPHNQILWYPGGNFTSTPLSHKIRNVLFHLIPAYIIDTLLSMFGQKTFMVKTHSKLEKGVECMKYFTSKDWKFQSENVSKLLEQLNETDRKMFNFDIKTIDWMKYMNSYLLGIRLYLAKENLNTLPQARSNLKKMKIIHYCLQYSLFTLFFVYFIRNTQAGSLLYHNLIRFISYTFKK